MTENVVDRLKAIEERLGPVTQKIEAMSNALGGAGNLKGVNKSLNQMAKNLDNINNKAGGLDKVSRHLTEAGRAAKRSADQVRLLKRGLSEVGSLFRGVAGMAGIYFGVGGMISGMKSGLEFQS